MRALLKKLFRWIGVFILAAVLVSCNFPGAAVPTMDQAAAYTQAAQTIIAELTQTAPVETGLPTPSLTATPEGETQIVIETPAPTETPAPSETPTLTATSAGIASPTPEILFDEDFSSGRGWHTEETDLYGFRFTADGYMIYVDIRSAGFWSIRELSYDDVRLETEAALLDGPQSGYYGVMCRHQDEDNYYALVVSPDGSYGIIRNLDGEFEFIAEGVEDDGGVIQPADSTNRVRGDCIGNTLALYANDTKLLEVQDDLLDEGVVGIVAGTRLQEGIEVEFYRFTILRP